MLNEVCDKCRPIVESLIKRIEELERRLAQYENAHTPPSKQIHYPKKECTGNSIGAPKGHKGLTRKIPTPNRFKELKLCNCPSCGKSLGRPRSIHKKIIEDIPDPQPLKITQFTINYYFCNYCNQEVIPVDPELPKEGIFGYNLQAEVALMKYEDRLPYGKIKNILNRRYDLNLTNATLLDITRRTADRLEGIYNDIKKQIKKAPQVNADETGQKVKGANYYTWVFAALTCVLFLIRPTRGEKVIKEALSEKFKGILTCDGYKPYTKFAKIIQRCWAHLLRDAKFLAEQYGGTAKTIYESLCNLFKRIKEIKISTSKLERKKLYESLKNEMISLIKICKSYKDLRKFAVKIENGLEHWFTCVLYSKIEPTNNRAERELREMVVQRKISSLWNEKGVRMKEITMSVFATWKVRKLNIFSMLRQTLSS